jgi:aspartyl protease family protein
MRYFNNVKLTIYSIIILSVIVIVATLLLFIKTKNSNSNFNLESYNTFTTTPEYISSDEFENTKDLNLNDVEDYQYKEKKTIPMKKSRGVYLIPVEINGLTLDFILDTGASTISISEAEAIVLIRQGTLDKSDFRGTQNFTTADGSTMEGTIINLRSVKIGDNEMTNIEASVMSNDSAPLLLGQSFLQNFGKVTIDYENMVIYFEN